MTATDPALLSASKMLARYRDRSLSPVEAVTASLARIERLNPKLNAFALVDAEGALAAARASEARWVRGEPMGTLDGVPVTIKDVVMVTGWPTRRGSKTTATDPAVEDGPATARLREAGAVFLGKTNTPEFAWKGVTDSPLTGITRNPWDPSLTPGGSSGGAAVAAACGMGALHIGTDGGGSIRIPAAFTGVFGLKATFGRIPMYPPSPFASLAHLGPLTRTVTDAALMTSVLSRPDPRDWYALPEDRGDWLAGLEEGVTGLRVAYLPTLAQVPVEPDVARRVAEAARRFEELGARVEEVEPGMLSDAGPIFAPHWLAAAAILLGDVPAEKHELMDPGLREVAEQGGRLAALDLLKAMRAREALGAAMLRLHQRFDLLILPTMPMAPFPVGQNKPADSTERTWGDWTPFAYPFNLTRQPAASAPCGFTSRGLPVGLQIVGRLYEDRTVLRAARAFERLQPFALPSI
jgi:aspartyl-tRNA(Asn)/glutamyl-tRNA(Gln) amidotransferase subunit A